MFLRGLISSAGFWYLVCVIFVLIDAYRVSKLNLSFDTCTISRNSTMIIVALPSFLIISAKA